MPNLPTPRKSILDIAPYVGGKSNAGGGRVIKLSSNESPLGPSPKALAAYSETAAKLHRYPDGSAARLREAIAQVYGLDASCIVCGAGSDELIGMLIHAYADQGDNIVYTRHGFLMYKIYAQVGGVESVVAEETNLRADVASILACITPRTKIVFLANPNNPTGSYITAAELKALRDGLPAHIILAVDAAYAEYVEEADYSNGLELAASTENTVMLRTFSKIYGLSALRLGWGYFPAAIADVLNRIRGPFNVSTPAQAAGAAAMLDKAFIQNAVAFNTQWLAWVSAELAGLGLHVYPSVANFVLVKFPVNGKHTASNANAFLLERGIIVREVISYGLPECLRMTIGTAEENQLLVAALKEFLTS